MEQQMNFEHRLTAVEDRAASNTKRLNRLEGTTEAINNALCVLSSAEWSAKRYTSSLEETPGKPYSTEWLTIGSGASGAWSVILILLIPCAAISYGLVTRYQRKKAK